MSGTASADNGPPLRVLLIAGSSRQGALSGRLLKAAEACAQAAGAQTQVLDLRALALPVYDGDLEASHGVPAGAFALRDAFTRHDAALVVTPEYNGFPTPLFLNAFDWLSRVPADAAAGLPVGTAATANKPLGLLSSSPGPLGGLRALNYVRQYLSMSFAMLVVPQQFALGQAQAAFGPDGTLADVKQAQALRGVVAAALRVAAALKAAG